MDKIEELRVEQLIKQLRDNMNTDDFEYIQGDVVEEFKKFDNPFVFVEPVIRLMEENPEIDFGIPGYLVHFVEQYYKKGYEELLIDSLERRPTFHTVWMLQRIINDESNPNREMYLGFLKELSQRNDIDIEVKKRILE